MDTTPGGAINGIDAARYIYQLFHYPVILQSDEPDNRFRDRARTAQPYTLLCSPFSEAGIVCNIGIAINNHAMRTKCLGSFPVGEPKKIAGELEVAIVMDTRGRIIF